MLNNGLRCSAPQWHSDWVAWLDNVQGPGAKGAPQRETNKKEKEEKEQEKAEKKRENETF